MVMVDERQMHSQCRRVCVDLEGRNAWGRVLIGKRRDAARLELGSLGRCGCFASLVKLSSCANSRLSSCPTLPVMQQNACVELVEGASRACHEEQCSLKVQE